MEAQRVKPFEGDIAVEMHFHRADKRRCDVDNLQKLLLDACNGILWKDDSQIVEIKAVLERASDEPGTWMKVWAR